LKHGERLERVDLEAVELPLAIPDDPRIGRALNRGEAAREE